MATKKIYDKHDFGSYDVFQNELTKQKITRDGIYINQLINDCYFFLNTHGVRDKQKFVELFKNMGMKANDIIDLITAFKEHIHTKYCCELKWLKKREYKKINFSGKEVLFNRLACEYPEDLLTFVKSYLYLKHSEKNSEFMQHQLQMRIENIQKQTPKEVLSNEENPLIQYDYSDNDMYFEDTFMF